MGESNREYNRRLAREKRQIIVDEILKNRKPSERVKRYRERNEMKRNDRKSQKLEEKEDHKEAIQQFFKHATVIDKERKVQLRYWNDEDNVYKTSYFYIADIKFTVSYIEGTNVVYNPIEINLVEY